MSGRYILVACVMITLSACTVAQPEKTLQSDGMPVMPQPKPQLDVLTALNSESVTVYPLTGDMRTPFSNKKLQPISEKVIGEGYPVLDPSVTVFPLKPPTSIPDVTFDNVQTGASSSLYSAKVKSMAAQRPPEDDMPPRIAPISEDVIGADIKSTPLAPIIAPPVNVSQINAKPVRLLFTAPGTKSGPEGVMKTDVAPLPISISSPPASFVDMSAPPPMPARTLKMQPIMDDKPVALPSPEPVVTTMPMGKSSDSDTQESDVVPLPAIPSLTGY